MKFTTKLVLATLLIVSVKSMAQTNQTNSTDSFFSVSQNFDKDGTELYSSNLELKRHKKIGFGLSIGGANGVLGFNSELNLDPENALIIGLGTGPSYSSFNFLYKRNFESLYLSPYAKLGYSKWLTSSGNTLFAKNSDILGRIYTEKELNGGRVEADFLISSFGTEYNQLEGELSGVNFYAEVVMMAELKKAILIPSGAVGVTYFY